MTIPSGQVCETCNRRVPYPKTDQSPVSATVSIRLPADDKESAQTMLADQSSRPAFDGVKYPRFAALEIGLALMAGLTDASLGAIVRERFKGEA